MSTRCINTIALRGPTEDLKAFAAFVRSDTSEFDFNRIIPEPKGLAEMSTNPHWYSCWSDWRWTHWGTGDDAWDIRCHLWEDALLYRFNTEETPPWRCYAQFLKQFPMLEIDWAVDIELNGYGYLKPDGTVPMLYDWLRLEPGDAGYDEAAVPGPGWQYDFLHTLWSRYGAWEEDEAVRSACRASNEKNRLRSERLNLERVAALAVSGQAASENVAETTQQGE